MWIVTEPCIIEVALNGVTPKALNPRVPRSPAETTADALACIAAGATVVHNHNDEPMWVDDGVHAAAPYIDAWRPILAEHPDVLLYATQPSGGPGIAIETRWAHHVELARAGVSRVGLVDPGSVSLGGDRVYINTHDDARYMVERCAELGLAPSVSIFDPSFLRVALAFHRAGELPRGALIKLYFGGDALPFGLPATLPASRRTSRCSRAAACRGWSPSWEVTSSTAAWPRSPCSAEAMSASGSRTTPGRARRATPSSSRRPRR